MTGKQILVTVAAGTVLGILLGPVVLAIVCELGDGDSGF
jgi:hypothetical protein